MSSRLRRTIPGPPSRPPFAALDQDPPGSLDAVRDEANMPLDGEPQRARDDLDAVGARAGA
ncbi:hypothetical protein ACGFZB_24985 [Streptomyces cinerochromogenes]|uniref:Uncharacterized protein n=1 Tax=Streptomyces cinerochromogenes TaxID=66422 RepID=A0ABW7B8Y8_9ACTN